MGSKKWITICSFCGAALVGHFEHEAHQHKDSIARPFAQKRQEVMIDTRLFARHHHNDEPEAPSGPIQTPQATVVSTSAAALSLTPPIFGSTGNAFPRNLVWNPQLSALVRGMKTNPSSGSNVPASSAFTITFPGGTTRSS